ncbi:hypothetical protein CRG98_013568 [Punica granatum]|uniref:Uncharacterized protein n=1 Tax=Punica granatum TaxID=22663 RepID=A0A2I0KD75_PUNGR|nr:hypothetical protein CRG98_013568 [Punica granatum]
MKEQEEEGSDPSYEARILTGQRAPMRRPTFHSPISGYMSVGRDGNFSRAGGDTGDKRKRSWAKKILLKVSGQAEGLKCKKRSDGGTGAIRGEDGWPHGALRLANIGGHRPFWRPTHLPAAADTPLTALLAKITKIPLPRKNNQFRFVSVVFSRIIWPKNIL